MTKTQELQQLTGNDCIQPEELIKVEQVPNTPFKIVTRAGESFLAMGRFKLTHSFNTQEEVMQYLDEHKWEIVLTMISIGVEYFKHETNAEGYGCYTKAQPIGCPNHSGQIMHWYCALIIQKSEVEVADGQFGFGMDEMEVEKIMNSENIIGVGAFRQQGLS